MSFVTHHGKPLIVTGRYIEKKVPVAGSKGGSEPGIIGVTYDRQPKMRSTHDQFVMGSYNPAIHSEISGGVNRSDPNCDSLFVGTSHIGRSGEYTGIIAAVAAAATAAAGAADPVASSSRANDLVLVRFRNTTRRTPSNTRMMRTLRQNPVTPASRGSADAVLGFKYPK